MPGAIARTAAAVGAYMAGQAARGAIKGTGNSIAQKVQRYFQGDPNQPATAKTVQRMVTMRPGTRRPRGTRGGQTISEHGTCKLADVKTSATTAFNASGCSILSLPIRPELIGGRFYAMSKLYSRWRFTRAVLRFVPSVGSTTDGGLVVYYTQEPDDVYLPGESVGAGAASSALDNMEFSVREKASMSLHLNPQPLFTTPSTVEHAWHTAGVVNVISNGALADSKVYGSLYLDCSVDFSQPCAPFDVYRPATMTNITPHGPAVSGTAGALFDWSSDFPLLDRDSGDMWFRNPDTGALGTSDLWLPPRSRANVMVTIRDTGGVIGDLSLGLGVGVTQTDYSAYHANDGTVKIYKAVVVNSLSVPSTLSVLGPAAMTVTYCNLSLDLDNF